MVVSVRDRLPIGGALLLSCAAMLLAASLHAAQLPMLDRGVTYSADGGGADLRSGAADLSGNVSVKQGPYSIESQKAKAKGLNSDNSRWTFEQAVHIRTAEADLRSNSASAAVVNGQIVDARVEGSPAEFQQVGGEPDRQVKGRAGVIEYDANTGIVKMRDQVWFSNGRDEFRGDVMIYSVRDKRLQINPGGSPGRVRGIIRPRENTADGAAAAPPRGEPDAAHSLADDLSADESGA